MKKMLIAILTVVMITTVVPSFSNDFSMISEVEAKSKVKLNKTKLTLVKGKSTTLKIVGTKKKAKWSTSNKKVATVNSKGKVTAKKAGTCTIIAKIGSKKYKCKIVIKNPIKISKTKLSLKKGKTYTLKVSGTKKKVKWSTSNKKVATVNSKGKVTAKKKGTCTITAKADGLSVKSKVTVKTTNNVSIDMLALDTTSVSLKVGSTYKMKVIILPENVSNKTLFYSSSNKNVVTVDKIGTVKGIGSGTATITVKSNNGKKVSCKFTVKSNSLAVTSISLNKSSLSLERGKSFQLVATINPSNATNKNVKWQSNNTKIATVSSTGIVTAKNVGNTYIYAVASNGVAKSCKVRVTEKTEDIKQNIAINSISLDTSFITLEEGKIKTLNSTILPSNATNQNITWDSSDTSIATVSSRGRITAIKNGRAIITAKTVNGKTATCTVNVIRASVVESKPKYDYDIEFLNEYGFYTGLSIVTHIKTNNTTKNITKFDDNTDYFFFIIDNKISDYYNGDLSLGENKFADIHYANGYNVNDGKVKDGYICGLKVKTPGEHTLDLYEHNSITGKDVKVLSKKIKVLDLATYENEWADEVISKVTNESMSDREKLVTLQDYIKSNFEYYQKRAGVNDNLLNKAPETTPYWISKEISCWGAASIMCVFAERLGYDYGIINTGAYGIGDSGHQKTLIDLNRDGYFTKSKNEKVDKHIVTVEKYNDIDTDELFDCTPKAQIYTIDGIDYFYSRKNIKYIDVNW